MERTKNAAELFRNESTGWAPALKFLVFVVVCVGILLASRYSRYIMPRDN